MKQLFIMLSLLLGGIAAALAQQTDSPAADFSRYEKKVQWVIPPEMIARLTAQEEGINYDEAKVRDYTLPDLFTLASGARVKTRAAWERRRGEMLDALRHTLYGYAPPRPDDLRFHVVATEPRALGGKATLKRVAIEFHLRRAPYRFHLTLFTPNRRGGPSPVFALLNHRGSDTTNSARRDTTAEYLIERGYALAVVNTGAEVEPDTPNATKGIRAFYRQNYSKPEELTWGAIGAWAWAASRAADYLVTDPGVNARQLAVIGHSRSGKAALWAGAQDTRFALTCNNNGGRSGPGIIRRNFGRELAASERRFPHWFAPAYKTYAGRVDALPYDGHFLVALLAPRAFHEGEASEDLLGDPRGSWLATVEASKAWVFFGRAAALKAEMPLLNDLFVNGPLAFHMREGAHALMMFDWKLYLDHADMVFRRKNI